MIHSVSIMLKIVLCILLISGPAAAEIDYTRLCVPVEVRGIWVNADAIPKTEEGIRQLVRAYKCANLNVLFPEVIARGYTAYPSRLLERDPRFAGCIDPLPPMIDEAHKLGMEVHPWVWVFRAGYTKDNGAILRAHPDWIELSKFGEDLSANGGLWISPAIPAARDFLASLYAELATNYNIDGIHLDYVRYEVQSPVPYGYSPYATSEFTRQYGINPVDIDRLSVNQLEWIKYRERQVNSFVQRIAMQTRAIRPNAKISAAVGSDPKTARLNLLQNWVNWVDNKWVDFVTPMAYTANDASFAALVTSQKAAVDDKTILAPGIGLHLQKDAVDQTVRQVGISRELLADGQALFASSYFGEPQSQALKQGPYSTPASLPFRDPCAKAACLRSLAVQNTADADYYNALAAGLEHYAGHLSSCTGYIAPAEPPLELPENVVPLPTVEIPKISEPIKIDGDLSDPAWVNATRVRLLYTPDGKLAPVETTAMLLYDDKALYVGFDCAEPDMAKIKATVTKRDGPVFYDDSVEAFIDPGRSQQVYYHFSTNTLGTQFEQKVLSPAWNADWSSAAKLQNGRWTAEMAIPFASLGATTPTAGDKWGLNLTRNRWTTGSAEYITWAIPYGGFHSPDRFGTAVFR